MACGTTNFGTHSFKTRRPAMQGAGYEVLSYIYILYLYLYIYISISIYLYLYIPWESLGFIYIYSDIGICRDMI